MDFGTLQDRMEERLDEDGTTPVFFTATAIKAALNRANRLLAFLTLCVERRDQAFALSAATTYYDISATFSDWLLPLRVRSSSGRVLPINQHSLDLRFGSWEATAGTPTHYFMHGMYFLGIYPRPAALGTSLTVNYAAEPAVLVNTGDVPETPEEYHSSLLDYAIYWLRWQEGGQEFAKSIVFLQRFLEEAQKLADYVRSRNVAQGYDQMPFDLAAFDRGRLFKMRKLAEFRFGQIARRPEAPPQPSNGQPAAS